MDMIKDLSDFYRKNESSIQLAADPNIKKSVVFIHDSNGLKSITEIKASDDIKDLLGSNIPFNLDLYKEVTLKSGYFSDDANLQIQGCQKLVKSTIPNTFRFVNKETKEVGLKNEKEQIFDCIENYKSSETEEDYDIMIENIKDIRYDIVDTIPEFSVFKMSKFEKDIKNYYTGLTKQLKQNSNYVFDIIKEGKVLNAFVKGIEDLYKHNSSYISNKPNYIKFYSDVDCIINNISTNNVYGKKSNNICGLDLVYNINNCEIKIPNNYEVVFIYEESNNSLYEEYQKYYVNSRIFLYNDKVKKDYTYHTITTGNSTKKKYKSINDNSIYDSRYNKIEGSTQSELDDLCEFSVFMTSITKISNNILIIDDNYINKFDKEKNISDILNEISKNSYDKDLKVLQMQTIDKKLKMVYYGYISTSDILLKYYDNKFGVVSRNRNEIYQSLMSLFPKKYIDFFGDNKKTSIESSFSGCNISLTLLFNKHKKELFEFAYRNENNDISNILDDFEYFIIKNNLMFNDEYVIDKYKLEKLIELKINLNGLYKQTIMSDLRKKVNEIKGYVYFNSYSDIPRNNKFGEIELSEPDTKKEIETKERILKHASSENKVRRKYLNSVEYLESKIENDIEFSYILGVVLKYQQSNSVAKYQNDVITKFKEKSIGESLTMLLNIRDKFKHLIDKTPDFISLENSLIKYMIGDEKNNYKKNKSNKIDYIIFNLGYSESSSYIYTNK